MHYGSSQQSSVRFTGPMDCQSHRRGSTMKKAKDEGGFGRPFVDTRFARASNSRALLQHKLDFACLFQSENDLHPALPRNDTMGR